MAHLHIKGHDNTNWGSITVYCQLEYTAAMLILRNVTTNNEQEDVNEGHHPNMTTELLQNLHNGTTSTLMNMKDQDEK